MATQITQNVNIILDAHITQGGPVDLRAAQPRGGANFSTTLKNTVEQYTGQSSMNATASAMCQTPKRACAVDDLQSSPRLEPERKVIKIDLANQRSPTKAEQRVPIDELR